MGRPALAGRPLFVENVFVDSRVPDVFSHADAQQRCRDSVAWLARTGS